MEERTEMVPVTGLSEPALGVANAEDIRNMVYVVRGKQVLLDSDLAKLYGYVNTGLVLPQNTGHN